MPKPKSPAAKTVIIRDSQGHVMLNLALGYTGPCQWPSYAQTPRVLQALRDAITAIEYTGLGGPRVGTD